MKMLAQFAKDPWRIVFELEVVPRRWRQLIANSILTRVRLSLLFRLSDLHVERELMLRLVISICQRPFDLGFTA